MPSPFTNDQKAAVAKLARRAYDAWAECEAINDHLSKTACFEAWRHVETGKATGGVQSLRACVSETHYLPLIAHFNHLLGQNGVALKTLLRHAEGPRITAFFKLQAALAERGLDENYAAAICQRQYKCPLGDATEKQLWNLFYTVRNRRKAAAPSMQRRAPRYIKTAGSHLTTNPGPF